MLETIKRTSRTATILTFLAWNAETAATHLANPWAGATLMLAFVTTGVILWANAKDAARC